MINEIIFAIVLAGIGILVTILIKTNSIKITQKTKTGTNSMNNNTISNNANTDNTDNTDKTDKNDKKKQV
ncbi:MAG: hypothetical protein WCI30_05350 [Clostridia bacterium]